MTSLQTNAHPVYPHLPSTTAESEQQLPCQCKRVHCFLPKPSCCFIQQLVIFCALLFFLLCLLFLALRSLWHSWAAEAGVQLWNLSVRVLLDWSAVKFSSAMVEKRHIVVLFLACLLQGFSRDAFGFPLRASSIFSKQAGEALSLMQSTSLPAVQAESFSVETLEKDNFTYFANCSFDCPSVVFHAWNSSFYFSTAMWTQLNTSLLPFLLSSPNDTEYLFLTYSKYSGYILQMGDRRKGESRETKGFGEGRRSKRARTKRERTQTHTERHTHRESCTYHLWEKYDGLALDAWNQTERGERSVCVCVCVWGGEKRGKMCQVQVLYCKTSRKQELRESKWSGQKERIQGCLFGAPYTYFEISSNGTANVSGNALWMQSRFYEALAASNLSSSEKHHLKERAHFAKLAVEDQHNWVSDTLMASAVAVPFITVYNSTTNSSIARLQRLDPFWPWLYAVSSRLSYFPVRNIIFCDI